MHGDGTKLDNIPNKPPPARLLDVTRLIRRAGRLLTGVDRVEMAYLSEIYDAEIEAAAQSAYQRDYMMFGFDSWG